MIAARWALRLIGLLSTVIFARLLAPDDLGVVAIALVVVGLLESIACARADLALVQTLFRPRRSGWQQFVFPRRARSSTLPRTYGAQNRSLR